ncbi:uncharacterized protein LOC110980085 [Acanthaster planci]|uniref:Uncharacterized protein LOC110980085 n=1 Tax=Acanthaster planci TaxID=133434 RepID=A0A8B7YFU3_ACAPL|nr:uncharacterized protein LOC110980085 [Acanthaster planci]
MSLDLWASFSREAEEKAPKRLEDEAASHSVSTGNFKRGRRSRQENISSQESVSQAGVGPHGSDHDYVGSVLEFADLEINPDTFFEVVKDAACSLPIRNAHFGPREDPKITSARFDTRQSKVFLSLAAGQKKLVDKLWSRNPERFSLYHASTLAHYKITEEHYRKYMMPSQLDPLLAHELGRVVPGFDIHAPKLPDKSLNMADRRFMSIEEAHDGMACAVSQLEELLQNTLDHQSLNVLKGLVDIGSASRSLSAAQETTLDMLDLQVREATNAKLARNYLYMWLQQTC